MQASSQHQTINSGQKKVGRPFGSAGPNKLPSRLPELVGKQFGSLTVISEEVIRKGPGNRAHLTVRCKCGKEYIKDYSLVTIRGAGCRSCGSPKQAPEWLVRRCGGAHQRCTNPSNPRYRDYGGRGIKFCFKGPTDMAVWIQQNLGLDESKQIDRINNSGNYAPGNLKLSTPAENMANTRKKRNMASLHAFRESHPEIKYADSTLLGFFSSDLTFEQIIDRWYNVPSKKPKGKYGTYLTPDPAIASLRTD